MAVRVGFEPTEPVKAQRFSRPPDSTTLAPHRKRAISYTTLNGGFRRSSRYKDPVGSQSHREVLAGPIVERKGIAIAYVTRALEEWPSGRRRRQADS